MAAAATLGGLAGGVGAERVTALVSQEALFTVLAGLGGASMVGSIVIARSMPARHARLHAPEDRRSAWAEIRRVPLLRDLALVVALAAALAGLVDYLLKAETVAWFGPGDPLVRFFGLFYAGTALAAFLLQALFGRLVLARVGLGGSVASHSLLVGAAGLIGFIIPAPWRGIVPRCVDVTGRASVFRAGYELFYTPLPDAAKRAAKSTVDVSADCLGKRGRCGPHRAADQIRPFVYVCCSQRGRGAGSSSRVCGRAPFEGPLRERPQGRTSPPRRGFAISGDLLAGRLHNGAKHGRPGRYLYPPGARPNGRGEKRGPTR